MVENVLGGGGGGAIVSHFLLNSQRDTESQLVYLLVMFLDRHA